MKKLLMTVAAAFVATAMSAQVYVGGTLGYQNNKTNNGTVTTPATTETTVSGFNFNPEIGMALDEKMGVGIVLGFGSNKETKDLVGTAKTTAVTAGLPTSTEMTTTDIAIKPYLRYQLLTYGKANIFVDGGIDFAMHSAKDMKAGMDLGLFVTPGIAFNINEKWSIVAKLNNMFEFMYKKGMVEDVDNAPDPSKDINLNLASGGFTSGALRFGVYYNF